MAVPTGVRALLVRRQCVLATLSTHGARGSLMVAAEDHRGLDPSASSASRRPSHCPTQAAPVLRPLIARWGARRDGPLQPSPQDCCDRLPQSWGLEEAEPESGGGKEVSGSRRGGSGP